MCKEYEANRAKTQKCQTSSMKKEKYAASTKGNIVLNDEIEFVERAWQHAIIRTEYFILWLHTMLRSTNISKQNCINTLTSKTKYWSGKFYFVTINRIICCEHKINIQIHHILYTFDSYKKTSFTRISLPREF